MRASALALMTTAAVLSAVFMRAGSSEAGTIRLAQVDADVQMGPSRSPDVLIEEPRPPSAVIETEGRGERRSCRHSLTTTEWQDEPRDGMKVAPTEQQCDG